MGKYIRVPLTAEMEKDYRECAEMMDNGQEKDCDGCSMNGGSWFECMGEYPWRKDDGWISVEDRLPEEEKEVLVTTDTGEITFGYISDGEWNTGLDPDYPIAWRPLPEPYRPEGKEEAPDWRESILRKFDRRE